MNIKNMLWSGVTVLWGLAAWLAISNEIPLGLRFTVVFGFIILCPGLILAKFLPVVDGFFALPLGIALSILMSSLVVLIMLWTNTWSPEIALLILIAVSVLGAVLLTFRDIRELPSS